MANKTTVTAEPGKQELTITREFDAPRELVFKAHIDPDQYIQWVGPKDLEMSIQKLDARDEGSFEFTHKRGGHSYRFFGVYHEVLAPERIIGTFEFDGLPERGHVIMGKTMFEELPGGRSRLVHQSVFFSVEDRDGMVQSGMERGVSEGYEKLDEVLAKTNSMDRTAGMQ
ncbi:MAG: SRPBCC family protein [Saprospiraceae bacterium]|nr:SRPBCC family protein [Pyrinomonadaceae bacterium]